MILLGSGEIDLSRAVAWDAQKHLSFAVPFQDMKPTIYLGTIKNIIMSLIINLLERSIIQILYFPPNSFGSKAAFCLHKLKQEAPTLGL